MNQHDPIFFTPPSGRARNRTLYKGGGGDSAYYKEANRLYGVQADTAEFMLGIGQENLPGAVDRYREASLRYDDPEYADRMAGQVFVFFILTVAAAESAIGLAILIVMFRNMRTIHVDDLDSLKG